MSDYDRYINITTLGNDDEEVIDGMLKAGLSVRQINDIYAPIIARHIEKHKLRDLMSEVIICNDSACINYDDCPF